MPIDNEQASSLARNSSVTDGLLDLPWVVLHLLWFSSACIRGLVCGQLLSVAEMFIWNWFLYYPWYSSYPGELFTFTVGENDSVNISLQVWHINEYPTVFKLYSEKSWSFFGAYQGLNRQISNATEVSAQFSFQHATDFCRQKCRHRRALWIHD